MSGGTIPPGHFAVHRMHPVIHLCIPPTLRNACGARILVLVSPRCEERSIFMMETQNRGRWGRVCTRSRSRLVATSALAMVLRYYVKYYVWEVLNPSQEPEQPLGCSKLEFSWVLPHLTSRSYIPNSYSGTGRDRVHLAF